MAILQTIRHESVMGSSRTSSWMRAKLDCRECSKVTCFTLTRKEGIAHKLEKFPVTLLELLRGIWIFYPIAGNKRNLPSPPLPV